jgi:hypothetical protein
MRPFVFVDVDGVLNYLGPTRDGDLADLGVSWPATNDANLDALAAVFIPVWSTAWGERANERFDRDWPIVPLGPVPDWAMRPGGGSWKLEAVRRFAGGRPAAWIDDDVHDDMLEWARNRAAATRIVPIHNHRGLTDDDVDRLIVWSVRNGG